MINRLKPVWGLLPVVILLALWEITARLELFPGHIFFPSFSEVMQEFFSLMAGGLLVESFSRSLFRVLIGFSAGSVCGLLVGILMGWRELVDRSFSPIISLIYPIPALGWLPLLMLWIGLPFTRKYSWTFVSMSNTLSTWKLKIKSNGH
jgi:ABC-type nitrate/sulfonate/bicarbonate transport system, permease component